MFTYSKKKVRPYYNYLKNFLLKKKFELKVSVSRKNSKPLRIVVGSSGKFQENWIRTEKDFLNLLNDENWSKYFKEGEVNNILAEHVWEHLSLDEGRKAAAMCHKYLKKGGKLRIAVPDGYHKSSEYLDQVKPGGFGISADDHKILYNYEVLSSLLKEQGFETYFLEYFDKENKFHVQKWNIDDGMIRRSLKYDHRNKDGKPRYTSLIIDAIKPH